MNQLQVSQAIFRRWLDRWPPLEPDVPFAFDNIVRPEGETLAQVSIVSGTSNQSTLGQTGNRRWERTGFIQVRLTGPIGEGRRPIDELAQHVKDIYEGVRFGFNAGEHGIVTHACSVGELRRDKDSPQLWILSVTIPFEYIEVR
jgi:hypothetical protein